MKLHTAALLTLASARLTRVVTTDKIGVWLIREPITKAADRRMTQIFEDYDHRYKTIQDWNNQAQPEGRQTYPLPDPPTEPWWWKYQQGLECPWCVGFWISLGVVSTDAALSRAPRAQGAYRVLLTGLAVNLIAAPVEQAVSALEQSVQFSEPAQPESLNGSGAPEDLTDEDSENMSYGQQKPEDQSTYIVNSISSLRDYGDYSEAENLSYGMYGEGHYDA